VARGLPAPGPGTTAPRAALPLLEFFPCTVAGRGLAGKSRPTLVVVRVVHHKIRGVTHLEVREEPLVTAAVRGVAVLRAQADLPFSQVAEAQADLTGAQVFRPLTVVISTLQVAVRVAVFLQLQRHLPVAEVDYSYYIQIMVVLAVR
jgi:hypothetical protein